MDDALAFAHFIQHVCNVNVACASNEILSFLPTFSSLMGTIDNDIDKFITAVHGKTLKESLLKGFTFHWVSLLP